MVPPYWFLFLILIGQRELKNQNVNHPQPLLGKEGVTPLLTKEGLGVVGRWS